MTQAKATIVILAMAAPDLNRKVYTIHRGIRPYPRARCLTIGEQVGSVTATYDEAIDLKALAAHYATQEYPVWELM